MLFHMQNENRDFIHLTKILLFRFRGVRVLTNVLQRVRILLEGFICDCLSYFITARITFTCILYSQCIYMIFINDTHHVVRYISACTKSALT